MNRVILLLLGLVVLNNSVLACVPAVAIKYIVKHRLEHFNDDIDITEPVRISKEDLEDYFNADKNPSFRIRARQNDTTATENPTPEETATEQPKSSSENPKTDEPNSNTTTVKPSNVSTTIAPTSTFKPGTLDDPNWIPGDFVDQHGNPKVIAPPPVTTVLQDFLAEIVKRNNRFLWTGANFLISLACQVLFVIGFTSVLCTYVPFFYMTKGMNSHRLPKSIRWLWEKTARDNFKIARSLARRKAQFEAFESLEEATETDNTKPNKASVVAIPKKLKTKTKNPNKRLSKSTASRRAASKPIALKPAASKPIASRSTASEATASKPTASKPTASRTASKPTASEATASKPTASEVTVSEATASEATASEATAVESTALETTASKSTDKR